jgi:hypothetical protein
MVTYCQKFFPSRHYFTLCDDALLVYLDYRSFMRDRFLSFDPDLEGNPSAIFTGVRSMWMAVE